MEGLPVIHTQFHLTLDYTPGCRIALNVPAAVRGMKSDATTCESRDILSSRWLVFTLYWLPAIAILAVGPLPISNGWRAVVWAVALAILGMACIVNALRCGRVHCYITGPFFLLMAPAALVYGLGILHFGGNGWNLLGLIGLIGTIACWYVPEMFLGKYRKGRAGDSNHP